MRSLAYAFDNEQTEEHRFLVRAGIAFGPFIAPIQMANANRNFERNLAYMQSVFVGCPLNWAYEGESEAPPFGIYIDQSVTTHSGENIGWALHRWWDPGATRGVGERLRRQAQGPP